MPPVGTRQVVYQHQYLDDNPSITSQDNYTIIASVTARRATDPGPPVGSARLTVKRDHGIQLAVSTIA